MKHDFALIFLKMYYTNMLLPKTIINFVIVLYWFFTACGSRNLALKRTASYYIVQLLIAKWFLWKINADYIVYFGLIARSLTPLSSLENQIIFWIVTVKLISLSWFYSVMIKVVKPLFILLSHDNGGSIDLPDHFFSWKKKLSPRLCI